MGTHATRRYRPRVIAPLRRSPASQSSVSTSSLTAPSPEVPLFDEARHSVRAAAAHGNGERLDRFLTAPGGNHQCPWEACGMTARERFVAAERRLFAHYGLECKSGLLRLADPAVSIGVREFGSGEPVLFIHGSGMSGATWAPVIAHMHLCRS